MKYGVFFDSEWLYPDTAAEGAATANLFCARNADACFQILTDLTVAAGTLIGVSFSATECQATVYQLLPAHVGENSGPKTHTTTDYESVKHFVTRKAPFDVYEITRPLDSGMLRAGRVAFFVRVDVPADAIPGEYNEALTLTVGEEAFTVPVHIKIYHATVPTLADASFHMVNWIYYNKLASHHSVVPFGEEYNVILRNYLQNQLDMRNDYLMLPSGEPIRDNDGRVVDFDFSHAEYVGNLALSMGFRAIMGGFSARFVVWNKPLVTLLWDRDIDVTSFEGYRQLSLYFKRAWECVQKNNWAEKYYQCMEDEPQFQNAEAYRSMAAICRKSMPGVRIHDPVECTDIGGALDVWVVKQATFEKYREEYEKYISLGEEMWLYTCGFPAGKTMNRIIDLPLSASLLPMWMCYKYGTPGFLHWGYHLHNPEFEKETCYDTGKNDERYPAGNSFVVYPAKDAPWYGVRGHLQRLGAIDFELFSLLGEKDHTYALSLIDRACRTFDDYTADAALINKIRYEILEALE